MERVRGERNAVANKMKGKMEPSERQRLIEEGAHGTFFHPLGFGIIFFHLIPYISAYRKESEGGTYCSGRRPGQAC